MDIKKELLKDHSKEQVEFLASYIVDHPDHYKKLMKIFLGQEYRLTQRSSWVVTKCHDLNPSLVIPYLKAMIKGLSNKHSHDAVIRNSVRILQNVDIPDEFLGEATDQCFKLLEKNETPIAIKAFSMTVLLNTVKKVPELGHELRILVEDQLPFGSAGFKSRAKKTLNQLAKLGH